MQTVDRAFDILACFTPRQPSWSVSDLSRELSLHKSVVSRLVSTLCARGVLERDAASRRLSIGLGAFKLGLLYAGQEPLLQLAPNYLGPLVERTLQSSHVAVLEQRKMLVVASVESPQALRVILRAGERRYLHASATGKILMAYNPPALLDAVVADELPALTAKTITTPSKLIAEVGKARKEGIAWNYEESTRGAASVAAPIFGPGGMLLAAICTVFPYAVVDRKEHRKIASCVSEAATAFSAAMGSADGPIRKSASA